MNIKFRAWDKIEKVMCEVTTINFNKGCFLVGNSPTPDTDCGFDFMIEGIPDGHFVKFDDLILMQSTTLKDFNHEEIYDKDIVKFANNLYVIEKQGSGFKLYDLNSELDENYNGEIGSFDGENIENFLASTMEVKGNIITYKKVII